MFGKLITAMITPFGNNNKINYQKVSEMAEYLVENGSEGIVVAGTTGESPSLTFQEKLDLFKNVKNKIGNRAKIIAGTGSNSTDSSIELSIRAAETGIDGIMLVTPYYNKPTQKGLKEHFKVIAESVPNIPIMLYNVPGRTGSNLLSETVIELSQTANIVAVKEASGNLNQIANIIRETGEDFSLYSGNDDETLPILALGGKGVVSVASHIVGKKIAEMIETFWSGDIKKASKIHRDLLPVFEALFISSNPLPVKAALKLLGYDNGRHRLPLCELEPEKMIKLKEVLQNNGIL